MSIGLSGAAGSGKSTLARAFALKHGWEFVPSPASACFRELGLPFVGLTFDERMAVQRLILSRFDEALWEASRRGRWISDRSPLDLVAYVMAEWAQRSDAAMGDEIMDYVGACFRVLNRHFSMVMLIQPGIPYVDDGSRPPESAAAQEIHNMLCASLMRDNACQPYSIQMLRSVTDPLVRLEAVEQFWTRHVNHVAAVIANERVH